MRAKENERAANLRTEEALKIGKDSREVSSTIIDLAGLRPKFETPETLRAAPNMEAVGERFLIDAGNILGWGKHGDDPVRLLTVQVWLVNVSDSPEVRISGQWIAGPEARNFPLKVSCFDDFSYEERLVKISRMERLALLCWLTTTPEKEGISLEEFEANWVPLELELVIDGVQHVVKWDDRRIAVARSLMEQSLK